MSTSIPEGITRIVTPDDGWRTPPELPPEPVACPRCAGAGSITVPSDNGPDAYDVDEVCPHCEGDGSLESAYKGVLKMLEIQQAETLKQHAKWWGIVNVKAKRDEFLLEVGETNARWLDPVGYWKEHAAEQMLAFRAQAVADEREACAKACEDEYLEHGDCMYDRAIDDCVRAIRARIARAHDEIPRD